MRAVFFLIASLLLSACNTGPAESRGGFSVSGGAGGCLFAATASTDGCAGAPTAGVAGKSINYGRATFFGTCPSGTTNGYQCTNGAEKFGDGSRGYAQQYNQSYKTLPNWNVAGVDYVVGIDSARYSAKNPANIHTDIPECTIQANGWEIHCSPISSCYDITIEGYDFSLNGGYAVFTIGNGCAGTATLHIKNNYWKIGTNKQTYFIQCYNAPVCGMNIEASNNYFDANYTYAPSDVPSHPSQMVWVQGGDNSYFRSSYNVYWGPPYEVISCGSLPGANGACISQFDYIEGDNYSSGNHGHVFNYGTGSGGSVALIQVKYLTFLLPKNFGAGMTGLMHWSNGTGTVTTLDYNHMTVIGNLYEFPAFVDNGLGGGTYNGVAGSVLTVQNTATAQSGPCWQGYGCVFAGSVRIYKNKGDATHSYTVTNMTFTAGISGATMTVSATSDFIPVPADLTGPGITTSGSAGWGATIVSQVSGSPGGTGVYTVQPSQSIAGGTTLTANPDMDIGSMPIVGATLPAAVAAQNMYKQNMSPGLLGPVTIATVTVTNLLMQYNYLDPIGAASCYANYNSVVPDTTGSLVMTTGTALANPGVTGGNADTCTGVLN